MRIQAIWIYSVHLPWIWMVKILLQLFCLVMLYLISVPAYFLLFLATLPSPSLWSALTCASISAHKVVDYPWLLWKQLEASYFLFLFLTEWACVFSRLFWPATQLPLPRAFSFFQTHSPSTNCRHRPCPWVTDCRADSEKWLPRESFHWHLLPSMLREPYLFLASLSQWSHLHLSFSCLVPQS